MRLTGIISLLALAGCGQPHVNVRGDTPEPYFLSECTLAYPYSDTYMNMLCNTTSCGHFKHSYPWSLAPVKPPFCRGKFWQYTQVSL
jgi:hypothetical protein